MGEFDRLVDELESRSDSLVASTLERVRECEPALIADSAFDVEELREFLDASFAAQVRALQRDALPDSCPEADAAMARSAARAGELKVLLNGYWSLQGTLWESWLDLVGSREVDEATRGSLLRRGLDFFIRYAGRVGGWVAEIYQAELEHASRDPTQRRFYAVRSVLEGDGLAAARIEYKLDQLHVGLVGGGDGVQEAVRGLARELDRQLLLVGPVRGVVWAWVSGPRPLPTPAERLLAGYQPPEGVALAIGLEGIGEAGFRATHRQALRAFSLASPGAVVRYENIAVESLAAENQEDARAFVARELRGIDDDSVSSRRIRETLLAYFAAEHNAASAAAALGVHQQTVANRLRAAEERLGRPIGSRRVELEIALRLRASLEAGEG